MKTITLVATTERRFAEHIEAMNKSEECFPFPVRKLIISGVRPENLPEGFEWRQADIFLNWDYWGYNHFIYSRLADFVDTDFIVTIHADGFAQHPEHWRDAFLDYDYVGAPFPVGLTGGVGRVGSGGFCLRSMKLLRACQRIPLPGNVTEDWHIGHNRFRQFEALGCRFAPVPLALRWSIDLALEDYPSWSCADSFGFHDNHGPNPKGNNPPFRIF